MNILYFWVVIFLYLKASSCQVTFNASDTRIVGGTQISITQAPYTVAISIRNQHLYTFHCGGTLVSRSLVITAAQCLTIQGGGMIPTSTFRVFGGSSNLNTLFKYSDVRWTKIHRDFQIISDVGVNNDIGLIKLRSAFRLDSTLRAIKMTSVPMNTTSLCTITGWGTTISGPPINTLLMMAALPIYNKTQCNALYQSSTLQPLHHGTICAGTPSSTAGHCQGDTGGPLVCNGVLTGIISFRRGCGTPRNYPGVYTDIQYYQDWIRTNSAHSISSAFILILCLQIITYVVFK